jgi:peptidoglycan/xylan/chitin deacetylase (PgdA/CDA1 family)
MSEDDLKEKRAHRSRIRRMKRAIITFLVLWIILMTTAVIVLGVLVFSLSKKIEAKSKVAPQANEAVEESEPTDTVELADDGAGSLSDIYAYDAEALKQYEEQARDNMAREDDETMKVYLTFDDGPSGSSDQILDILDDYNVKATFFVNGRTDDHSISVYKRIVDEGHTIAMHSYTHKYNEVYASLDNFKEDLENIRDLIYDVTGVESVYYRFPGGSSNRVSATDMSVFIDYLDQAGITYFDWNVMSGDATSSPYTSNDLIENVMGDVVKYKSSVVLMHDADNKKATVEALPELIETLQKMGAQILPIDEETTVVQHIH